MTDSQHAVSALEQQLLDELQAMVTHALGTGIRIPDAVVGVVMEIESTRGAPLDAATLVRAEKAHELLSRAVAPATPKALDLLDDEAHRDRRFPWLPSLGPVPLVRQLTAVGLLFLVGFILLGLSSSVSRTSGGILDSSGTTLLLNLLFVLCASGLGAVFAALFKVNQYIADRTYDPIYESSYWVNIVLGLIGGLLLAELLLEVIDAGTEGPESGVPFARPLLALVGGFSAKVVFQILNRLVEAVGSLFKGDMTAMVAAQTEAARARLAMQQTEDRVKVSTKLIQLQQSLNSGTDPQQLAASVNSILDELLPYDTSSMAAAPRAADPGADGDGDEDGDGAAAPTNASAAATTSASGATGASDTPVPVTAEGATGVTTVDGSTPVERAASDAATSPPVTGDAATSPPVTGDAATTDAATSGSASGASTPS